MLLPTLMRSSAVVRANGPLYAFSQASQRRLGKLNEIAIWKLIVRCPLERRRVNAVQPCSANAIARTCFRFQIFMISRIFAVKSMCP